MSLVCVAMDAARSCFRPGAVMTPFLSPESARDGTLLLIFENCSAISPPTKPRSRAPQGGRGEQLATRGVPGIRRRANSANLP